MKLLYVNVRQVQCSAHILKKVLAIGHECVMRGHMYIRRKEKKNKASGKSYYTHELVESRRTEAGPRQITLLNLNPFDLDQKYWKQLSNRIKQILNGQQLLISIDQKIEALARHYASMLIKQQQSLQINTEKHDFQSVDVNGLESTDSRSIGREHIGLKAMEELGLNKIFKQLEFDQATIDLASVLIVGRLIHPSSERELKRYVQQESGFNDLLRTNISRLSNNSLYETSDILFSHKDKIEKYLSLHAKARFSLGESIILYDLTNTFFEGNACNYDKARRGRSKEKRSDRPLATLGLIMDELGFPKASHVYSGNVTESKTLMEMVKKIQAKDQKRSLTVKQKPTVVIDAGIATNENLNALKDEGYSYIVVSRSKPEEIPENLQLESIKKGIKAKSFKQGDEIFLHCKSDSKAGKENSIIEKSREKVEKELDYLRQGLTIKRRLKNYDKIQQRIGRIRQKNSRVSAGFEIKVTRNNDMAADITWSFDPNKLSKAYDGSYFLRTNRTDLSDHRIWSLYVMLTTVEDAFRCLKDELGLRPNFHRKPERIEGHIFITILAYHLLHYIRFKLTRTGLSHRWPTILSWLSTHRIHTTSLPREEGGAIHIRHCTKPTIEQQQVYSALEITNIPVRKRKTVTKQK